MFMQNTVRIGIIGTSFVSDWMAHALAQTPACTAAAVYSRSAERGEEFARKHGVPLCFCDLAAFLQSEAFDAVYIASPNAAHYAQILAALQNGKHVLCEKPLTLNCAQAQNAIDCARARGLVLMEAIRPLYDPFLAVVRENLPRIGRIRRATFAFCQYSSRYDRFKAGAQVNVFDATLGNAALMDLGVYCVHCCAALFGKPNAIHAGCSYLPNGTEAAGTALLDYGAMQACIAYSKVTDSVAPSMIEGENGSIVFDTLNQPSYVKLCRHDKSWETLPFAPAETNMTFELQAFAACVRGEAAPDAYQAQTLLALSILEEIRRQNGIDFGAAEEA